VGSSQLRITHMHVVCTSACDLAHGKKDDKKPPGEQWVDTDLVLSQSPLWIARETVSSALPHK